MLAHQSNGWTQMGDDVHYDRPTFHLSITIHRLPMTIIAETIDGCGVYWCCWFIMDLWQSFRELVVKCKCSNEWKMLRIAWAEEMVNDFILRSKHNRITPNRNLLNHVPTYLLTDSILNERLFLDFPQKKNKFSQKAKHKTLDICYKSNYEMLLTGV